MLYVDTVSYVNAIAEHKWRLSIDIEPIYREGKPYFISGGAGVIFKVLYQGELYALKCFTTITNDLLRVYRDKEIDGADEFVSPFNFMEDAIVVDTLLDRITLPVVLMKWAEGRSLSLEIERCCNATKREELIALTNNFILFAHRLLSSSIIHSDIKCDNIITDGTNFILVDTDALTTSERNLWYENRLISPWYNHPELELYSRLRDHYPIAIIVASLIALEVDPTLLGSFVDGESLIFRPELLIRGCDEAFNSVKDIFNSHISLKHLGDYISSRSYPRHNLALLLYDIAAVRSLVRYNLSGRAPRSDGLYSVKGYLSLMGFARGDGSLAIPVQYDDAMEFSESLAAVSKDGLWSFIDSKGDPISDRRFRSVTSFKEGVAAAAEGDLWGYVDREGNYIIEPKYSSASPLSHGKAQVVYRGGKMVISITSRERS